MKKISIKSATSPLFSLIVGVAIIIAAFTLPTFRFSFDVSLILTVVSLLFAILVGFFLAGTTSNFLRFQTLIADENATLIAVYGYVTLISPEHAAKVANAIDDYLISSLDYEHLTYAQNVQAEFTKIIATINTINPTNDTGMALFPYMHTAKMHLYGLSQETSLTAKRIVSASHWVVVLSLAFLMDIIMFGLRDGTMVTSILISILIMAIFLTLKLLDELDSNRFLTRQLSYQNPQSVFDAIGKLRYYPETSLRSQRVLVGADKKYRLGVYSNFPHSLEKRIRVVRD